MSPLNKIVKTDIANKINVAIQKVLDSPELEQLSQDQIEKIAKAYYTDRLKDDFEKQVKRAKLDKRAVEGLVDQWLSGFQSRHTVRSFVKNLEYFLSWLNGTSIIDVNSQLVDKYISYLNSDKKLSNNTKRQRLASPSSFYSDLTRWGIVSMNPFKGARGLPKKQIAIKEAEQIPSNDELDLIENYALKQIEEAQHKTGRGQFKKLNGNIKALCALRILRKYGLRVGSLDTLKIDRDGNFKATSKGKEIHGHFDEDAITLLLTYNLTGKEPFRDYSGNAFSMWLWRIQDEMGGKLKTKYSPHSIRHRFAIDFYNRTKDIHQLSVILGHTSVLVTSSYLSGLKNFIVV